MKKNITKKINTLNRNIHINGYRNYLIYSYLNNYNLKLFFLTISKKRTYCKNIKLVINTFRKLKLVSLNFKGNMYIEKNFDIYNSLENKFFSLKANNRCNQSVNIKFKMSNAKESKNVSLINNNFFIYDKLSLINTINTYKEISIFVFLINLSKQYEYYKILTLLFFVN